MTSKTTPKIRMYLTDQPRFEWLHGQLTIRSIQEGRKALSQADVINWLIQLGERELDKQDKTGEAGEGSDD